MSVSWQTHAKDILSKIKEAEDVDAFLEPVDWKGLGLDDYPEVVKHPMDLKTLSNKLKKGEYKRAEEFFAELDRIWTNCQAYNQPGSDLYNVAIRLQKECNAMRDKFYSERRRYREEVLGETLADRVARRIARLDGEALAKVVQFVKTHGTSALSEEEGGQTVTLTLSAMEEGNLKMVNQLVKELLKSH
jgi:hypothetical protein